MAHFIGKVHGQRGPASRLGSSNSGIATYAASWEGAVRAELHVRNGQDWATVSLVPWHNSGIHKVLYDGPVSGKKLRAVAKTKERKAA